MPHLAKVYWRSHCHTWHLPTVAGIGSTKFEQVNIVCLENAVSIHAPTDTAAKLLNHVFSLYLHIFHNMVLFFVLSYNVFKSVGHFSRFTYEFHWLWAMPCLRTERKKLLQKKLAFTPSFLLGVFFPEGGLSYIPQTFTEGFLYGGIFARLTDEVGGLTSPVRRA